MRALALAAGVTIPAVVLIACDGGASEPPFLVEISPLATATATPTPEPTATSTPTAVPETPTPPPESGGLDGFRAFAHQIEQAIANRNAQFFIDRARISEYTCPGEPGLVDPRCSGRPIGTVIEGVYSGPWRSEAHLMALDSLREDLAGYLDSLSVPTLHAIGDRSGHVSDFFGLENAFYAVVASSDDLPNTTRVLTFEFSAEEGGWRMAMVVHPTAAVLAEDWLSGECGECYDYWERWEGTP